ncbi:four-helix bundle copper-binding protein [Cnuella takakiae]
MHDHDHCKRCAEACRRCEQACHEHHGQQQMA